MAVTPDGPYQLVTGGTRQCGLVELPEANHYIQEDGPDRISEAIIDRFG
ncbi:hypothetical protein [Mycobacterium sp.]